VLLVGTRHEHRVWTERIHLPLKLELQVAAETERYLKAFFMDMQRGELQRALEEVKADKRKAEYSVRLKRNAAQFRRVAVLYGHLERRATIRLRR
jgi:hypothetical protein